MMRGMAVLLALAALACNDGGFDGADGTDGMDGTDGTDGTDGSDGTDDTDDDTPPNVDALPDGTTWTWSSHPCDGYRVDALEETPDGRLWLGCGTDAAGYGLYVSADGGETWGTPSTDPVDYFTTFRVNDLFYDDGLLYVSGDQTAADASSADAVAAFDPEAAEPVAVSPVFVNGNQIWNSFLVGTYRRLPTGEEVAESLTGTDAVWRASDADPWSDGYGWWAGTTSYQILDLEVHDGAFYGAGSTIAQPPTVFLPPTVPTSGFAMDEVELTDAFTGELWDLHVDDDGLIAVGVDQDADVGTVFTTTTDGRQAADWDLFTADALVGQSTWFDGACRVGQDVVVVGRFSQTDKAFAIASRDGGDTWADITPADRPALQACRRVGDTLVVAGGAGAFAVLTLP